MSSITLRVMDTPSLLPYTIQCHTYTKQHTTLEHSLTALVPIPPEQLSDFGIAEAIEIERVPADASLPALIALCGVQLFRYTSSTTFKFTVSYKLRAASLEKSRKVEIQLSVQPYIELSQLVLHAMKSLQSVIGVVDMPSLCDVDYICLDDQTNESSEIVDMSIAGGFYLRFKSSNDMFTTTFSFAKLLSFSDPQSINVRSHWNALLQQVQLTPSVMARRRVCDIPILSTEERHTLLNNWNKCPEPNLYDKIEKDVGLLHQLFERQADLHPDNIAVAHDNPACPIKYSYRQANNLADQVAMYLLSQSKKFDYASPSTLEDTFIAHLFPRCAESYIAMLGILKSGAAYVPLDPAFPLDRVTYILQDCKAKFIITTVEIGISLKKYLKDMKAIGENVETEVLFWEDINVINARSTNNLSVIAQGIRPRTRINTKSACYVIYTSGSTGKPKGCIIEHRSAINLVLSESSIFPLTDSDTIFQNFSLAFDASIETIWLAFFNGATLYIPTEDMMHSGSQLTQYITDANVTVLSCVPTMLNMLSASVTEKGLGNEDPLPTVKLLILGGEACPKNVIEKWSLNGKRRMVNTYGPTEATVIGTYSDCRADDSIVSIGTAVPNYEVYILDPYLQPVPIGAIGELHLGGVGVARGYLNRPELNKEKFIENPFSPQFSSSSRLYKTGDLARFIPPSVAKECSQLPEGSIEYLGRIDMQVKIRGYRVELSEIESVIVRCCSQVANAVVNLWKGEASGNEEPEELFVGYIVLREGISSFNASAAKEELKVHLPAYMIPTVFQVIEDVPVLPSGKVNRKMLPHPTRQSSRSKEGLKIDDSLSLTERKVLQYWAKLLLLDDCSCGLESDFFELGGHSMVAAKLVSALRVEPLYGDVGMTDVYKYRTLKAFAQRLDDISDDVVSLSEDSDLDGNFGNEKYQQPRREIPSAGSDLNVVMKYLLMFIGLYIIFWFASLQVIVPFWAYFYIDLNPLISADNAASSEISMSGQKMSTLIQSSDASQDIYTAILGLATILLFLTAELVVFVCSPLIVVIIKWIVLGRVKPGVYPLWGVYYWRWWIVHRLIKLLPLALFKGSVMMVWFYRLMGASIGKNVHIGTPYVSCLDMLEIGDDTSIGIDVFMEGFTVKMGKPDAYGRRQGWLIIGTIEIGSGCYVGSKSHVGIDAIIPDDTCVAEFSMVPESTILQTGKSYAGSPLEECNREQIGCEYADAAEDPYTKTFTKDIDTRRLPHWIACVLQVMASFTFVIVLTSAVIPGFIISLYILNHNGISVFGESEYSASQADGGISVLCIIAIAIVGAVGFIVTFCLEVAAIKWILLGDMKTSRKVFHVDSWLYVRKWFVDSLMQLSLIVIQSLYATLCLPIWFRLMGAEIGKHCEIATARHLNPDMLKLQDGSFIADAVYLGPEKVHRGWVQVSESAIGDRSFIGNSAFVPTGVKIGDNCLLGALSRPPMPTPEDSEVSKSSIVTQFIPDGKSWLGSPGLFLPKRATAQGKVSLERTFKPPWYLYLARISIEMWRITLPTIFYWGNRLAPLAFISYFKNSTDLPAVAQWLLFPILYVLVAATCCLFVLAFKYVLIGRYCPREAPLWSSFVWRTELITALEEGFANMVLVNNLRGTPLICMWFRLLGGKIGKRVWMETSMIIEADLLTVGDDCAIGSDCILQTHLFEDRVMKMSHLKIGNGCTIGAASIALYDGVMEDGATLGSFSLLMKGERLIENSNMAGIPAEPMKR